MKNQLRSFLSSFPHYFFLCPFYIFGPLAYMGGKGMSVIMLILSLSFFFKPSLDKKSFSFFSLKRLPPSLNFLGTLVIYMMTSSFWAFKTSYALGTSLRLLSIFILGNYACLSIQKIPENLLEKSLWSLFLSWSFLLLLLFLTIIFQILIPEVFKEPPLFFKFLGPFSTPLIQITKPPLFAALFFWPLCAFIFFYGKSKLITLYAQNTRKKMFLATGLGVLVLIYPLGMTAASLGLTIGLCAYLLFKKYPSTFSPVLNSSILSGLFFPFYAKFILIFVTHLSAHKISWAHRVLIWNFVSEKIKEAPLFGWGLEASRFFSSSSTQISSNSQTLDLLPLHPHNAFLQLWLEGGFVGCFLLSCLLWALVAHSKKVFLSSLERALLGGTFITIFIPFCLSFGIWQTWWLSTLYFLVLLWIFLKKYTNIKNISILSTITKN